MSLLDPHTRTLRAGEIRKVTLVALLLNLLLTSLKLVGGLLGNSQALIADAVHSLSDLLTDLIVLIGVRFWSAPADREHPHGHGRIETVVTAAIGLLLGSAGFGIAYHGVVGLISGPRTETIALIAVRGAIVSIIVKEGLFRWTFSVGKQIQSQALIANARHQRADAISSLPTAFAVAGAAFSPSLVVLDNIGAIVVAAFILRAAWGILWPALAQIVDQGAPEEMITKIASTALGVQGVLCVHAVRTRHIGCGVQVDLHIMVNAELSVRAGHDISKQVSKCLLKEVPEIVDVVVHLEPWENCEKCARNCEM